ncbi:MAG: aldo/keto reductase [Bryobacteraceae bacterium]
MEISRRTFLGSIAATPVLAKDGGIPKRTLGRTGAQVSIVALGGGNNLLVYGSADKLAEAINRALDAGVTYIDTSASYGSGQSETFIGNVMKTRRKDVFLATKVSGSRTADHAMRSVEGSLKRLQTDRLDLIHIHDLKDDDDLAAIEAKESVLTALYQLRDQKVTRAIGITSHRYPATLKAALERHDFDCTQMALNAGLVGMKSLPGGVMAPDTSVKDSFEAVALPVAKRKNMGVIAMKVYARGAFEGHATPEQLLRYALTLPVTTAVIGMSALNLIDSNVQMAKNYKPLSSGEMRDLSKHVSDKTKVALDMYFADHQDS